MKKGISLIVLVITILVIIVLASTVIISLSESNPILSAHEATFKSDVTTMQIELDMYITKMYAQELGNFDPNTMDGLVSDFIPSVTKYDNEFEVVNGKLVYKGEDNQTITYVRNMNLEIETDYDGTVEIIEPTTNVIDVNQGTIEAWVNVTNVMREEIAEKYIFSTYTDEKYTNTLALRHTRDNTWQAIMSSDYNNVSDISVVDTLNEGWHLFSVKWNSSEFSLFIDGVKVATTSSPKLMQAVSTDLHIGSGPKLNLVRNGYVSSGDASNFPQSIYTTSDYVTPGASLSVTQSNGIYASDLISIDPNKSYTLMGDLKSIGISGNSRTYFGFITYDIDKAYIGPMMTSHFINTETKLTKDLNPGDTIVYVENATNWKKTTDVYHSKYLGIYPYKDYPLYTYTRKCYLFDNSNDSTNTITLTSPYSGTIVKAGTKVANNYNNNGEYTYSAICGSFISNVWTKYIATTSGEAANYGSYNKFRYGTRYIRPLLLLNYAQYSSYTTLFDNIEFIDNTMSLYNSKIQEVCISNIARIDNDILNRYTSGILTKDSNVTYLLTEQ